MTETGEVAVPRSVPARGSRSSSTRGSHGAVAGLAVDLHVDASHHQQQEKAIRAESGEEQADAQQQQDVLPLKADIEAVIDATGEGRRHQDQHQGGRWTEHLHHETFRVCMRCFREDVNGTVGVPFLIAFLNDHASPAAAILSLRLALKEASHSSTLQLLLDVLRFIDLPRLLKRFLRQCLSQRNSLQPDIALALAKDVLRALAATPALYMAHFHHRDSDPLVSEETLFPALCAALAEVIFSEEHLTCHADDIDQASSARSWKQTLLAAVMSGCASSFSTLTLARALLEAPASCRRTDRATRGRNASHAAALQACAEHDARVVSTLPPVLVMVEPTRTRHMLYRGLITAGSRSVRQMVLLGQVLKQASACNNRRDEASIPGLLQQMLSFHTSRDLGRAMCLVHLAHVFGIVRRILYAAIEVWGDETFVTTGNPEAHMFLSQIIVLGIVHWLHSPALSSSSGSQDELLMEITQKTSVHLNCVLEGVRWRGLAVTEIAVHSLVREKGSTLDFKLPDSDDIKILRELAKAKVLPMSVAGLPADTILSDLGLDDQELEATNSATSPHDRREVSSPTDKDVDTESNPDSKEQPQHSAVVEDDYDSDDLPELDGLASCSSRITPNATHTPAPTASTATTSTATTTAKRFAWAPKYIADAVKGLKEKKDFKKVQASIECLPAVMRRYPEDTTRVAKSLLKTLLFLQNEFNLEGFGQQKRRAMVTLVDISPRPAFEAIVALFYEENASLVHRRVLLEVVVASAALLAGRAVDDLEATFATQADEEGMKIQEVGEIEKKEGKGGKKTRYFHPSYLRQKKKIADERSAAPNGQDRKDDQKGNRLVPVAGIVFFPLINSYDKPIKTLKLLDQDKFLLSLLLRTLGILMYLCVFSSIFSRMATTFCNFVVALLGRESVLRDGDVQQALLTSTCIILEIAPPHVSSDLSRILSPIAPLFQVLRDDNPNPASSALAAHLIDLL